MLRDEDQDLIVAASEIKANVQQGLTLINVYGGMGTMAKMATILMRKSIHQKFDKVWRVWRGRYSCSRRRSWQPGAFPLGDSQLPRDWLLARL